MRIKLILICLIVFSSALLAERTKLKPGRNVYTPQQDIDLGREVAKDAERQLPLKKIRQFASDLSRLWRNVLKCA